ncbi:hypothetical protein E0W68_12545 [Flavobacterium salilacus subsp. salilacus]|uniref:hypothetical protein n=1 Tax=Flavobacterium TaxID=237 RepID=UPI00107503F4|nr:MULTISPECIES: hypothetical protein [Flavobacterium]KAF2515777.1 hypothetical protein E0W68_12545 [Flavobacterium salilacus subsp. salilacus]MBE1615422.1 hypothetical protein [Flavobacterium sp. SaA2.13]
MKYFIVVLFLLLNKTAFSQVFNMEKDTIQMEEVFLKKELTKYRLKTIKLKGQCYYAEDMWDTYEIVTLLEDLPEGYFESISFTFNGLYTSYKEQLEKFKATELELVVYEVNDNNTAGDRIVHETKLIHIGKEYIGKVDVDVSGLNIRTQNRLFVGVRRVSGNGVKNEFSISCLCNGQDKYITLTRINETSAWKRRWECAALQVAVSIQVAH